MFKELYGYVWLNSDLNFVVIYTININGDPRMELSHYVFCLVHVICRVFLGTLCLKTILIGP